MIKIKLLFIFACLAVVSSLTAQNVSSRQLGVVPSLVQRGFKFMLKGRIVGFKRDGQDNFIDFSTYGLDGSSQKIAVEIGKDGTFSLQAYGSFKGDVQIRYKNSIANLFIDTGEGNFLTIVDEKAETGDDLDQAFKLDGERAEENRLMLMFQSAYGRYPFIHTADMSDKSQSDSIYASKRLARMDEELFFLNNFIRKNKVVNKDFIAWQKNNIIYIAGKQILFFPFLGKLNKTISEKDLYRLINQIPISNEGALQNSAYYAFLKMLADDEQIILNINPKYKDAIKSSGYNEFPIILSSINTVATGTAKEILYFDSYPDNEIVAKSANQVWDMFISGVDDPFIRESIELKKQQVSTGFVQFDLLGRIADAKINDTLKKRLSIIFTKLKGSNTYVDFWGDWCAPCMLELPNYNKFIPLFKEKPINFLFLSAYTSEAGMLSVRKRFSIPAQFINLSKDEIAAINNIFDFHSYPSHFVINQLGIVVGSLGGISNESSFKNTKETIFNILDM